MKRSMVVETASGVVTSMSWWSSIAVDGTSVVMTNIYSEGVEGCDLVVGELRSQGEAQALLRTVMQHSDCGARRYRAGEWPGLACDQVTDNSAGGG